MRKFVSAGLGMLAALLTASDASATSITAFEEIGDSTCSVTSLAAGCDTDLVVDLYRLRQDGAGPLATQNTDATIILENSVDADFGLFNNNAVTYTHVLSWLPSSTFLTAVLSISAYDVQGGNEVVVADTLTLGGLVTGNNVISTQIFNNPIGLTGLLTDGQLALSVTKFPANDQINVFLSRLTVTYDNGVGTTNGTAAPVPEPASLVLLGSGLVAVAARARRKYRAGKPE